MGWRETLNIGQLFLGNKSIQVKAFQVVMTVGTEAANAIDVAVQLNDPEGKALSEVGVVDFVGILVADHQTQSLATFEAFAEGFDVLLQILEGNAFFVDINTFGSGSQPAHQGQITTPVSHYFDHKAAPRGNRGLFDFIDRVHDIIQGCINSDAEI